MTCQELDDASRRLARRHAVAVRGGEVEAHLAACAACREGARKLRQVLAHATALPGSVAPPRDLWPGIESRIARPSGWSGSSPGTARRCSRRPRRS